jgi:hypothetical protein
MVFVSQTIAKIHFVKHFYLWLDMVLFVKIAQKLIEDKI